MLTLTENLILFGPLVAGAILWVLIEEGWCALNKWADAKAEAEPANKPVQIEQGSLWPPFKETS